MELQSYGISVRIAYPPNMQTTGYNEELKRTPKVVDEMMKVSGDTVFSADDVSKAILKGKYSIKSLFSLFNSRNETKQISFTLSRHTSDAFSVVYDKHQSCALFRTYSSGY